MTTEIERPLAADQHGGHRQFPDQQLPHRLRNNPPMGLLVADCPRCGAAKMTFDVKAQVFRYTEHDWKDYFEVFSVCRVYFKPTTFFISLTEFSARKSFQADDALVTAKIGLNPFFKVERPVTLRDNLSEKPPEYLPKDVEAAFQEGATCLVVACYNAAATMFRLCIDLVTKPLLPAPEDTTRPQPNSKQRRDLGLRLKWMFEQRLLPSELQELASCIREDANDGAHAGTLSKEDADDVRDFTRALLERLITEPARLKAAEDRRVARRQQPK